MKKLVLMMVAVVFVFASTGTHVKGLGQCTTADECSLDCVCHALQLSLNVSACAGGNLTVSFSTKWPLNFPTTVWTEEPDCIYDTQELEYIEVYRQNCSTWSSTLIDTLDSTDFLLACDSQGYTVPDSPGTGNWTYYLVVKGKENCAQGTVTYCTVYYVDEEADPICVTCS